jgi:hypothetical protein
MPSHLFIAIFLQCRTLGTAASATGISSHGDGLLVLLHILEESNSALQLPAVDGLSGLAGVLEGNSQVGTAGAGRLGGLDLGRGVSNLFCRGHHHVSPMFRCIPIVGSDRPS